MGNYILSFSYGDYDKSIGGTDKVIREHKNLFHLKGIGYLHLSPFYLLKKKKDNRNNLWLLKNDREYCVLKTEKVIDLIFDLERQGHTCIAIHIHHLLGFNLMAIQKILKSLMKPVVFYVHDFYKTDDLEKNGFLDENGDLKINYKINFNESNIFFNDIEEYYKINESLIENLNDKKNNIKTIFNDLIVMKMEKVIY